MFLTTKSNSYIIPGLLCFFIFQSCATVYVDKVKDYPAKPRDCNLDIYMTEESIEKPYDEICILDSRTGTTLFSKKTFDQAIRLAKPKACECGADAILVSDVEKQGINLLNWGQGRALVMGIKYK